MNKDILNKKEKLEKSKILTKDFVKKINKCKILTNDFVKKIDKCKTNEEFKATYNEIKLKLQDLNNKDNATLINKLFEKNNSIYKEKK